LPLAVTLRNPEVDAVAALRPNTTRDAFRKAAAEELLRAREEALGRMRRAGVLVLDVPPERAAHAVVAKYLELKRRAALAVLFSSATLATCVFPTERDS